MKIIILKPGCAKNPRRVINKQLTEKFLFNCYYNINQTHSYSQVWFSGKAKIFIFLYTDWLKNIIYIKCNYKIKCFENWVKIYKFKVLLTITNLPVQAKLSAGKFYSNKWNVKYNFLKGNKETI